MEHDPPGCQLSGFPDFCPRCRPLPPVSERILGAG